jgi:GTP-binding protein HflX
MHNLETLTEMRIMDRSGLILDIFAQHASTRTAKLQVELAQLKYLLPKLTGHWTHLSRQAGGGGSGGMGVAGVRGPGETQLETDRRLARNRISALTRELARIEGQMKTARKSRSDSFRVALVGYTNTGKSTLMRALSGSDVLVQDQLFATLDSTTRAVDLDQSKRILLTDTVGFIRKLPKHLFASFRATLAETEEADLLLHVVDFSHEYYESQIEAVDKVLGQLEVMDKPRVLVFNKIDQLEGAQHSRPLDDGAPKDRVSVSALSGAGLDTLKEIILFHCRQQDVTLDLQIPQREGRLLSHLHEQGEVLEKSYEAGDVMVRVRLGRVLADRWQLERFAPVSVQ